MKNKKSKLNLALFILFLFSIMSCELENYSKKLHQIFSDADNFHFKENPISATYAGIYKYNNKMPSISKESLDRRLNFWKRIILRLNKIELNKLSNEDKINYSIFQDMVKGRIDAILFKDYQMPINADSGFHTGLSRLHKAMSFNTESDYLNYISRLDQFPRFFDEHISNMKEGIAENRTLPQVVLNGYEVTITTHIVDEIKESAFFTPFTSFPKTLNKEQKEKLLELGSESIKKKVIPSFQNFLDFFLKEYYPNARKTLGASELPNGNQFYQYKIKQFTTLDLNADEIHNIGLSEVKRIRKEMDKIIADLEFDGTFEMFLDFLRTDKRFYAKSAEDLLKEASFIAKKMDAKLPSLFKKLPRLPYGVAPVPDDLAPKYTGGRYSGPAKGSNEAGYYWVNTYKLEVRPLYNLEALTLHEGVPGHHLQNSIAAEITGLPDFRKRLGITVFGEGWGLYSEFLGLEAGFYKDPYSNFGRLTYEMWRACRLVVDTGIHAKNWSRQKVIDYLSSNTALPIHECTTETDRYIAWPGQALAYKIGELKIKELRKFASKELGQNFDLKEFHDTILWSGELPLDLLEQNIKNWIEVKKGS
tara:strand:- start:1406 stop:3175 length:1770 start_codon:yes stop_codon:yes gene_type:complete